MICISNISMHLYKSTAEWPLISREPYLRYNNTQNQRKIMVETRSWAEALTQLYSLALTINQPLCPHSDISLYTLHCFLCYHGTYILLL